MSQARTYPPGVTSWIDLAADDVAAAQEFYEGLFGWNFTLATPPDLPVRYLIAQLDGQDVAGLGGPASPSGSGVATWHTYVAVDSLEQAVDDVVAAGGALLDPIEVAGEGGRNATVADPQGVTFRLWEARRRLGAQVSNVPGAWNFSDLRSEDPAGVRPFYERVFGWRFADMGFATMIQVPGYGDHLASTVDPGIHERQASAPPGFADVIGGQASPDGDHEAGWHVTFTVADRDESAARAESLGARVVRREEDDWTRSALIADPQGARLTLSQFTPPEDW